MKFEGKGELLKMVFDEAKITGNTLQLLSPQTGDWRGSNATCLLITMSTAIPNPKFQTARPTYRLYTHARARGRTHACLHARTHTHAHTRTHARTLACTHARSRARVHTHTHTYALRHACTHTRARARAHARTHTHTHTSYTALVHNLNIMLTAYAPWTGTSEMTDIKP